MNGSTQHITLTGEYGQMWEEHSRGYATDSALMVDWSDTAHYTYIHADTLFTEEMKKTDVWACYSVRSINELIRRANENGFFVTYNHPVWSLQNYEDYAGLEGLWGVEVWNTGCVPSISWISMSLIT